MVKANQCLIHFLLLINFNRPQQKKYFFCGGNKVKKLRSKFNFNIIIIISLLIFMISCKKTNIPQPIKGKLNLIDWDFEKDGIIKLNKEWEFYWKQLITSEDFRSTNAKLSSYFKIPKTWYRYKLNNSLLNSFGYATYRIILYLKNDFNKELAIKMPKVSTAYNLYINGNKIASNGIVGKTKKEMKPQYLPLIAAFKPESGKIEIIIQVSNFYERLSGLRESIFIGERNQIYKLKELNLSFNFLLFGCVLLMAIYNLNIFIFRKKDLVMLYFGLFCLVFAFRITISSELFLCQLFPDISWNFIRRSFALTFFLSVPLFCMYIQSLYSNEFSKKIINIIKIVGLIFSILALVTPAIIYTHGVGYYNYFTIYCCFYVFYVLFKALIYKREGALIFLIVFFVFFITIINDILYMETYLQSMMLLPYGLLTFIFFQVFILSRRFSLSFTKVEIMSDELKKVNKEINELNINLEKKVQERTLELEHAKNEIEEASKEKSQFFINLAHETKTPLTLILNYFKYYKTHFASKKGRIELGIIEKNLYKLKKDMINFLNHEKLISGEKFYNHDKILFLNDYLDKNISLYRITANNKKILIDYNKPKHKYYIKIDPSAMDEILHNIIINAITYTGKNGLVKIRLTEVNNKISLRISDNGIGMTDEQLKNLFNSFYQISNKKRSIQGMGIGLSIVKELLDQINGVIEGISKVNEGTTFIIKFNKYTLNKDDTVIDDYISVYKEDNLLFSNNDITFLSDNYSDNRRNLLIIEDNKVLLSYLQKKLNEHYNTYCAFNGLDAINKLKNIPKPDVIISDIMMDHMDGYTFLNKMKKSNYYDIPLIFLTARIGESDKIKGLREGVIDYIYKPFLIEELELKIENIIKYKMLNKKSFKREFVDNLSKFINKSNQHQFTYIKREKQNNNYNLSCLKKILTNKEIKIVEDVLKGNMNKEISSDLNIAIGTVKRYMNNIYKKLNVQNRIGLVNKVQEILNQKEKFYID